MTLSFGGLQDLLMLHGPFLLQMTSMLPQELTSPFCQPVFPKAFLGFFLFQRTSREKGV